MFNVGSVQGYLKLNTTGWTTPIASAQLSIQSLARTMTRAGTLMLGGILLLEREFGKFDKAIRHATSVTETTEKEFKQMSDMALDASVRWNKAATDTAQAFYFLGSAGLTVTEQMQAYNDTIMLSRAMGSSLATTVEGMIDIVRAFGLEFSDATDIADQLTKTVISSNLMFQDLDAALSYVSSTARLTNNTLAETNAMLGVMANAGIKGCYDNKTEVLTRRGWIPWQGAKMSDEFATCNPDTNSLEYQKPIRLICYHHKGKMYHVANRGIDLCVTPEHRMWVKKRDHDTFEAVHANKVDGKNVRYKAGGLKWKGDDPKSHILNGFTQNRGNWDKDISPMEIDSEIWAAFLGWYIAEGSCDYIKGNYRIRITQNKGKIRDRMRNMLQELPVTVGEDKNGFVIHNEQIWRAIKSLGKAPQKHIPQYALDWSPRLLNILLESLMEGDGDCNECYYTSSKQLADNVMEIALKLGFATTFVLDNPAGTISGFDKENREIKAQYDQWKVSVRRKQLEPCYYPCEYRGVHGKRLDGSKFPNKSEWIDYDGEVFCAEVPNHLLIVRRNGKVIISGNSMAGTVLRRAMTNLMSPTGEMAGLVYELGLHIYDAAGQMKPFIDIIGEISDKLAGTSEEYRNMVFEVLFGRRAIAGQITLFNYGSAALRKYANEIRDAGGITEKVAGKQMKAFLEILGRLFREIQRAAIEMGDMLAPAVERVSDRIRASIGEFRQYVQAHADAVMHALKWTAVLGTILVVGGPVLLIITSLISKMIALATVITKPWVALIASLYVIRAVWKQTSEEMIKRARETAEAIAYKKVGGAGIMIGAAGLGAYTGMRIGGPVGAGVGGAIGLGLGGYEWLRAKKSYQSFVDQGKEAAIDFGEVWSTAFEAVKKQMKVDFGAGLDFVDDKLSDTGGLVGGLVAGFKKYFGEMQTIFNIFMEEPYMGFHNLLDDLDALNKKIHESASRWEELHKPIKAAAKAMTYLGSQWDEALRTFFAPPVGEGKTWADTFVSVFQSIQSSWADTIDNLIREGGNFKDFIENMFLSILYAFNRMLAEIVAADLMYAISGGKYKRLPGTPSIMDIIKSISGIGTTDYNQGIQMPKLEGISGGWKPGYPELPTQFGGGQGKMIPVYIDITNKGAPVDLHVTDYQVTAKRVVISAVMEELNTNPSFKRAIRG